ncbi:hypothetical protein ACJ41O_005444 [Fusarium nematophilum]
MRFPFISLLAILASLTATHGREVCLSVIPTPTGPLQIQNVYYMWVKTPLSNHISTGVKLNRNIEDHQIEKALPLQIELCNQVIILQQERGRLVAMVWGKRYEGINVTVAAVHGGPCFGYLPQRNRMMMPAEGRCNLLPKAEVISNHLFIDAAVAVFERGTEEFQARRRALRKEKLSSIATSKSTRDATFIFTDSQSSSKAGSSTAMEYKAAAEL